MWDFFYSFRYKFMESCYNVFNDLKILFKGDVYQWIDLKRKSKK